VLSVTFYVLSIYISLVSALSFADAMVDGEDDLKNLPLPPPEGDILMLPRYPNDLKVTRGHTYPKGHTWRGIGHHLDLNYFLFLYSPPLAGGRGVVFVLNR
jgi:hypothetical protein